MSTTKLFRAGLIATVGVAGLTLTANAQSRYGNVYDYESGRNCGQACVPAAPVTPQSNTRYGAPVYTPAPAYTPAPTYNPAPVYIDCVQAGTCAPQPAVVYSQPAPVYSQPAPVYSQPSYTQTAQMTPANCPAGTTAQSDGTCMQGSSFSSSTSSSTFSGSTYSGSTYSAPSVSMEPVNCPSGTTAQPDGTCMQGSSFSSTSSFSSGSTYSEPSYSSQSYPSQSFSSPSVSMDAVNCPAGTTAQSDGTCMQGSSNSFAGSSIELYTGDATTSSSSSSSYGYSSDGSYGSTDYLPIRK